ncbi:MAG: hypothetical protein H7A45_11595 [Verrucomicrobiales bacterium]|nr:hypothetical protein [Verrucomicrobiales bacterium]MCP5525991.1 hypothetical protein [Verrucomicrobiales bacterium]
MATAALCLALPGVVLAGSPALAGQVPPVDLRIDTLSSSPEGLALGWTRPEGNWAYTVQAARTIDGIWITPEWRASWPQTGAAWTDTGIGRDAHRFYRVLAVEPSERGHLLSSEVIGVYGTVQIKTLLKLAGVDFEPQLGVEVRQLVYETIDPIGNRTVASGALVLPQGFSAPVPLVTYQHGTMAARSEAPSLAGGLELMIGVAFASVGYAASLPDYLGLGVSTIRHPYHHAKSEATAAVDMLRATRQFCAANNRLLNDQLFLFGYSQGGHATLALLRELETFLPDEFPVTAAAPMAGAYDLAGTTAADILSGRRLPNPYYFALLLSAYQDLYHFADSLEAMLVEPWRTTVPPLLDGEHSGAEINAAMPDEVLRALRPEIAAALRDDPDHPLRQALEVNSLLDWTPVSPLRLYHCTGDQDVVFANSIAARDAFAARGAAVELIEPAPGADHGGCVMPSLLDALAWFETFRGGPGLFAARPAR